MTNNEHPLSWEALGRIVIIGLGLLLAWKALNVLIALLFALILATAVFPLVRKLHKKKVPLLLSAIIVFAILLLPFVLVGIFIVPNIVAEMPSLIGTLHSILARAPFLPESVRSFNAVNYFMQNSGGLLASTKTVVSGVIAVVTVFFMAFYFVLDHERFLGFFIDLFPHREHKKVKDMLTEIARVNGLYIRGNVVISIICALYLFIVLAVLKVPFALPLAIFAGIFDLLPLVGSTLGTIPALIIAYAVSPLTCVLVLIFHLIYQQLENVVISPAIYHKALDISPALSFLAVVVGGGLFGIIGAFLALPVAASLPPMTRYIRHYQREAHGEL